MALLDTSPPRPALSPALPRSAATPTSALLRRVLIPLLLVALAAAPYVGAMESYFLGDDFGLIWLFEKKPAAHFPTLFWRPWTEDTYGNFADELRPTVAFSYWLDGRLFGSHNPWGFHLDNVVVHVLCTLLVWGIARKVVRREVVAAVAAAIFAVHGIHAEAVTWISGRADPIPALFYCGAFLAWVRFRDGGRWPWLLLTTLASALALFSKQSGVTFVGMIVAYDVIYLAPAGWLKPREALRRASGWLPPIGALAGYLLLRRTLFGSTLREDQLNNERWIEFFGRQQWYTEGVLFGGPLDALSGPEPSVWQWLALASVAGALLALLLVLVRRLPVGDRFWRHLLFFGPVWYGIGVLPLLMTYRSPRHLYMPTVGGAILLALLIWTAVEAGRRSWPRRAWSVALTSMMLIAMWSRLAIASDIWTTAALGSERMVRGIDGIAESLPPRSKVVLLTPGAYGDVWLWMWSLPYATEPPFARGTLYARHDVIDAPSTYCCPVARWWATRGKLIEGWLNEPGPLQIELIHWDAASGHLQHATLQTDAVELRERLITALGRPIDEITDASDAQAAAAIMALVEDPTEAAARAPRP